MIWAIICGDGKVVEGHLRQAGTFRRALLLRLEQELAAHITGCIKCVSHLCLREILQLRARHVLIACAPEVEGL